LTALQVMLATKSTKYCLWQESSVVLVAVTFCWKIFRLTFSVMSVMFITLPTLPAFAIFFAIYIIMEMDIDVAMSQKYVLVNIYLYKEVLGSQLME
jgi:uncharacterized protein YebE (UPF0316 family)